MSIGNAEGDTPKTVWNKFLAHPSSKTIPFRLSSALTGLALAAVFSLAGCAQNPEATPTPTSSSSSSPTPTIVEATEQPTIEVPEQATSIADQITQAMSSLSYYKFSGDMTSSLTGEEQTIHVEASVDARNGQDNANSYTRTSVSGVDAVSEAIFVNGKAYSKDSGGDWQEDSSYVQGRTSTSSNDLMGIVRQATAIDQVGAEDVDGVATTKYHLTLVDGEADIWVDQQNRLVQTYASQQGQTTTVKYYDFDVVNDIQAPI